MRGNDESEAIGMDEVPRLPFGGMTPDELDAIAEKAAKKALEHVYTEIGKSVVRKAVWLVGIVVLSLLLFLAGKNALWRP